MHEDYCKPCNDLVDAPYECNAGAPYEYVHNEKGESVEIELLEVLFYLPKQYGDITLPRDYGFNSPFSIRDINAGAVAWIYYRDNGWNQSTGPVAIDEGDSSPDVVDFEEEEFIAEMNAEWRKK